MKGEFELIQRLTALLPPVSPRVEEGIGDDAAVLLSPDKKILATVDALVEGIHFDWKFCRPEEVGQKAMAVNMSDIAAMGGVPTTAMVSLGLPSEFSFEVLEGIYRGIAAASSRSQIDVVGGNISKNPERLWISISLLGESGDRVLKRSGAQVGDIVFLSGVAGEAAAGLALLQQNHLSARNSFPLCTQKYLVPQPKLALGSLLASSPGVHSLIDLSDGLSSELWHLSEASQVGFVIREKSLPFGAELQGASHRLGIAVRELQWSGGEDYELLGTCDPKNWKELKKQCQNQNLPIEVIGEVCKKNQGLQVERENGVFEAIQATGWNHLGFR